MGNSKGQLQSEMPSERTVALTSTVLVKHREGITRTQPRSELLLHHCAVMSPSDPRPFISTNSVFRCKVYDKPERTLRSSPLSTTGLLTGSGWKLPVAYKDPSALRTVLFWVTALQVRAIPPPGSLHESRMSSSSTLSLIYTNTCELNCKVLR